MHHIGRCVSTHVRLASSLISFETVLASVWLLQDQLDRKKNTLLQVDQSSVRNSYSVFSLLRWELCHVIVFIHKDYLFNFQLGKWFQVILQQLSEKWNFLCQIVGVLFTVGVNKMEVDLMFVQFLRLKVKVKFIL